MHAARLANTVNGVPFEILINSDSNTGTLAMEVNELKANTYDIHIGFRSEAITSIHGFELQLEFDAADMHGMFKYPGDVDTRSRLPFWENRYETAATRCDPYFSFFHQNNENRFAFGLKDVMGKYSFRENLSESERSISFIIKGPMDEEIVSDNYSVNLFVSFSHDDYFDVFGDYRRYIDMDFPFKQLAVPECAYEPVFNTWYAKERKVSAQWVEKVAPIAAELGFRTILLDDGWMEYPEEEGSYVHLGTWVESSGKFKNFAEHVKRIKALGMYYMLWVAPFRMGWKSELASEFTNLGSHDLVEDPLRASIYLDPRYEKVQLFVEDTLNRLIYEYGVDGLKIDFIDPVGCLIEEHMDPWIKKLKFGEHFNKFMSGMMHKFKEKSPDLLIESRQSYSNLSNRCWTNCYRSPDVPLNFHENRFNCANLRKLYPEQAVYFDPALWSMHDTDENVGRHMISAIIAVPMISVEFDLYPQSHLQIIKHWIGFYREHKATLMKGLFKPMFRLSHLPEAWFVSDKETIIGLYDDRAVSIEQPRGTFYILNGALKDKVDFVAGNQSCVKKVTSYTKFGNVSWEKEMYMNAGSMDVEVGGYLKLEERKKGENDDDAASGPVTVESNISL